MGVFLVGHPVLSDQAVVVFIVIPIGNSPKSGFHAMDTDVNLLEAFGCF